MAGEGAGRGSGPGGDGDRSDGLTAASRAWPGRPRFARTARETGGERIPSWGSPDDAPVSRRRYDADHARGTPSRQRRRQRRVGARPQPSPRTSSGDASWSPSSDRRGPSRATGAGVPARFTSRSKTAAAVAAAFLLPGLFGGNGGGRGAGWAGCVGGAEGAACDDSGSDGSGVIRLNVSALQGTANLTSAFDCEGGEFEVTWSGSVTIWDTIRIGYGTTVSIRGDYDNGLPPRGAGADGAGSDQVSGDGLTGGSAIVAGEPFGPMLLVEGASLYLENMALRDGNVSNATSPGIVSGGGLHLLDADVTVVGCEFEDVFAQYWGGGIFANRSRLVVLDTVFRRCSAGEELEGVVEEADGAGGGLAVRWTPLLDSVELRPVLVLSFEVF